MVRRKLTGGWIERAVAGGERVPDVVMVAIALMRAVFLGIEGELSLVRSIGMEKSVVRMFESTLSIRSSGLARLTWTASQASSPYVAAPPCNERMVRLWLLHRAM